MEEFRILKFRREEILESLLALRRAEGSGIDRYSVKGVQIEKLKKGDFNVILSTRKDDLIQEEVFDRDATLRSILLYLKYLAVPIPAKASKTALYFDKHHLIVRLHFPTKK